VKRSGAPDAGDLVTIKGATDEPKLVIRTRGVYLELMSDRDVIWIERSKVRIVSEDR